EPGGRPDEAVDPGDERLPAVPGGIQRRHPSMPNASAGAARLRVTLGGLLEIVTSREHGALAADRDDLDLGIVVGPFESVVELDLERLAHRVPRLRPVEPDVED